MTKLPVGRGVAVNGAVNPIYRAWLRAMLTENTP